MPDGFVRIKRGERRPLYGQASAPSGTLTVAASPTPTCTLYDSQGAAVAGLANVVVTGYDTAALASPRVWYNLDTTSPTSLAAGFYTLVFAFTATGSDGLSRKYEPSLGVQVLDVRA